MRESGTANILPLDKLKVIPTVRKLEILSNPNEENPNDILTQLLGLNSNFINWIEKRNKLSTRPKLKVFRKYLWYANRLTLLEAINGFETFYKSSLIAVASILRDFIDVDKISGEVDIKVLWVHKTHNPPALLLESKLFHKVSEVNKYTTMFIEANHYKLESSNSKGIQCMFQIRHTLSHNNGKVTKSDRAKFKALA